MSGVSIYLENFKQGIITDSDGNFSIKNVCEGKFHVHVSHVGCKTQRIFLNLKRDTVINFFLDHHSTELDGVLISEKKNPVTTQESLELGSEAIQGNIHQNFSNQLEAISGVSIIRNGNGISKPVVQGLSGSRLLLVNSGVVMNGQQWCNDHGVEIDPLSSDKISVIKGVATFEFQGNSLGAVVKTEPGIIENEPHLHGRINYYFETNGLGNGANLNLQKHHGKFAWRANATFKRFGDKYSPGYFQRNTGGGEANLFFQFEKFHSLKFKSQFIISAFQTELGVLRGSVIGNTTDLQVAYSRDVPFFTKDEFSYRIDAPKQQVGHYLAKYSGRYFFNEQEKVEFNYAGQLNIRREFDVRRAGRSTIPYMNMWLQSHFAELIYRKSYSENSTINTGIQNSWLNNYSLPGTGTIPLIPDYISNQVGFFVRRFRQMGNFSVESGGRYDFLFRKVTRVEPVFPNELQHFYEYHHSFNGGGGLSYRQSDFFTIKLNSGGGLRNPTPNELYSFGLHQSISGIEEGDLNLRNEVYFKSTLSISGRYSEFVNWEITAYSHIFNNYIYLYPTGENRLTIRGAFPVFRYTQHDAVISGLDAGINFNVTHSVNGLVRYSFIRGNNLSLKLPLVYMPANSLFSALKWHLDKLGSFKNLILEANARYVFKQNHLFDFQDFIPVPEAYLLLGAGFSIKNMIAKKPITFGLRCSNLLNSRFRDYLNKQRYFSDDIGVNLVVSVQYSF